MLLPAIEDNLVRRADVRKVTDGDTLALLTDDGYGGMLRMAVRLYGINAPERKGDTLKAGNAARDFLKETLIKYGEPPILAADSLCSISIRAIKDKHGLAEIEKYGRVLVEVLVGVPPKPNSVAVGKVLVVNSFLVTSGHAETKFYLQKAPKKIYQAWGRPTLEIQKAQRSGKRQRISLPGVRSRDVHAYFDLLGDAPSFAL